MLTVVRQTRQERVENTLKHSKKEIIGWLTVRDVCPNFLKNTPKEYILSKEEYEAMDLQSLAELVADRDLYEMPDTCMENRKKVVATWTSTSSNGDASSGTYEYWT